jgi:molybdate transport system substrate-binding protein
LLKGIFSLLLVPFFGQLMAQDLMIAAGAGYKKPVNEIVGLYEQETGKKVNAIYGNIQMVASQAQQTGEISCIIGDKKFLKKIENVVSFTGYYPIGEGQLVLAYRKGIAIDKPEDLLTDQVKTIFMPQDGKAIYGIAAAETLKSYGYSGQLAPKVTQVATVPQVVSYLLTGEVDAGFINLTEALANKDKLGGYFVVDKSKYSPIMIVAGVVKGFEAQPETQQFIKLVSSGKALPIYKKYGLK